MTATLRLANKDDAQSCGLVCFNAFKAIADQHNFPPDFPVPEITIGLMSFLLSDSNIYSVVAEIDGRIVGSNFLSEKGVIAGVGPITIDPEVQNSSVGKQLMEIILQRADERLFAGVRLVQAAYHNRSLSLYTKLGFDTREPLSVLQGPAINVEIPGYSVRLAENEDVQACNNICLHVHGHHRKTELVDAIRAGMATVVEHNGTITGYTTQLSFLGHSVAETNNDLKALISAATTFGGPGFILPTRNSKLLRWCLMNGLRINQPMTLMSRGLYNEPDGVFLPSVLF
ncbi:GNAT family N-acetyltransferase [Segetibacter sp. 3557_3]|uniref:GNAT family N-acetyltransferase n=1 Tax=Segetibacter sp. 3557_3 TaxID=2547429 RepID=UPI001058DD90|nr:GNAT family N-acetyltransferase [Segetibacter sp. 3557_3]TDH18470.1 GNAT family N-acetyltransferase [Segetibacter sp. 3557_3]